ncbi:glycoside hydrolase family 16 protein [Flammeovirgaceae bacterium SG7u.111]|nr:glycoside hydrolase family 16 protein [Flammeovirgaceae bacterium SG7u.132]WPO33528.1 glycoside hydrolase family 16 protein [Flammeovirgaceae bacterium SG7u.111]
MKMINLLILIGLSYLSACSSSDADEQAPTPDYEIPGPVVYGFEDTVTWSDEFDYTGKPDPAKWGYDIGGSGWGNQELQYYTDSLKNAQVADGVLKIQAIKEDIGGMNYSSTRLISKEKGDFLYGRIEVRAKLPTGVGTWPAIWMLPTDWAYGDWPKSGEIDIMEHVGYDQDKVHITVHTEAYNHSIGTQVGKSKVVENVSSEFHTYRVDWTPESITGYIDNEQLFLFKNDKKGSASWPFDKRFHLLLNIAVGGSWGGVEGVDETAFPTSMEVDYVRFYKLTEE